MAGPGHVDPLGHHRGRSCAAIAYRPRYVAGATTALSTDVAADALVHAASTTFAFKDRPERDLGVLHELVLGCACYRLVVSDLNTACELVLGAFDKLKG